MLKARTLSGLILLVSFGWGCDNPTASDRTSEPSAEASAAKGDQWGNLDDPKRLDKNLEYRLSALPLDGEADRLPWAGSYWPTYEDSINYRWDGEDSLSPSEKYALAYGDDALTDKISKMYGVDAHSHRKACKSAPDCVGVSGTCAIRIGEESGRCIPTWWGVCHAWAPAAIMEPEPVHPVEVNGVTFKVNDIKALMTIVYNWVEDKHVSLRCDSTFGNMAVDAYGNPTGSDIGCKDTNPGTFHVVVTNYLGLKGKSFVEDRTADAQVWNQPVARYRVTQQDEVTVAEAHALLDILDEEAASETYLFNDEAETLYSVTLELDYVAESASTMDGNLSENVESYIRTDTYQYILEVDADGRINGGEWASSSKKNHPDFLWVPTQLKTLPHTDPAIAYWRVKSLLTQSL